MNDTLRLTFDDGISQTYEVLFRVDENGKKYLVLCETVTKQIFVKRECVKQDGSLFYDVVNETEFRMIYRMYIRQSNNYISDSKVTLKNFNISPDLPPTKQAINRIFSVKAFPATDSSCIVKGSNSHTVDISRFTHIVFCSTLWSAIGKHGEIDVDLRIYSEEGTLCCYYNIPVAVDNAETQISVNIPVVSSDRVFHPGNYVAYMSVAGKPYKECYFAIVHGNNYSCDKGFGEKTSEPIEKAAAAETIDTIRNAVSPKRRFTYSFFSYLCESGFMIAFISVIMMCMGIMSFLTGMFVFLLSTGVGGLILTIYIKNIPVQRKKKAAITFLLHGLYIQVMALMIVTLVLIPLMIYLANYKHYRYELELIDGVYMYVRYEE